MNYIQLKYNFHENDGYTIVPYREEDLYVIMKWRNEQMDVLRQNSLLTEQDQHNYWSNAIVPSFSNPKTNIILFSFLQNNKCIGYGGLTNINWNDKRIELSFLADTERTKSTEKYTADFSAFISLIKKVVFDDLQFNRMHTETFDIRPLHVSILTQNGFKLEGRMREHVIINGKKTDSLVHGYLKSDYEIER